MEEAGHELCFISHPKYDRRVSCDIFGNLRMRKTRKGWEVWRFIKDDESGNYIITSWTHDHRVLCSNEEGGVFTTENKQEKWKITLHPEQHGVTIQSVEHDRYLAFSGDDLYTTDKLEDTAWNLGSAHGNHFFISATCHDKRLSSTNDHPCTNHNRKLSENWAIEPSSDHVGQFTICSLEHGKYLGSSEDGSLIVGESPQCWTIGSSPHGCVLIQSVKYGSRLSCDDNGHPSTVDGSTGWENWRLEAIMPGTISGKNIWSWVGVGVTTLTVAVAAPFAVMGAIGAMGFGAEGIAAGTMAAGMMSTGAIANGSGVVAGGTVAVCQSIGAAGLGAAGASAAVGAGAVVGGMSSLGVAAATGGLSDGQERIESNEPDQHLPLCSWRMWE